MSSKKFGKIFIILPILCGFLYFTFLININQFYGNLYQTDLNNDQTNNEFVDLELINYLKIATNEPNGNPLLVHQYTNITEVYTSIESAENFSYVLYDDWVSQNTTILYEGVTQKRNIVNNSEFNSDDSGWDFKTNCDLTKYPWQSSRGFPIADGCTGINGGNAARSAGDYGYLEQIVTLSNEIYRDDIATFSCHYFFDVPTNINATLYMSVFVGNKEINQTVNTLGVAVDTWQLMSLNYDPTTYGQILPGNVTVRVGIIVNENSGPERVQLYLDNIKYEIWTESNENGILRTFDFQFLQNHTYYNTTYGEGYAFIDTERAPDADNIIEFTVFSNISRVSEFKIDKLTIISHAIKKFNTTISSKIGSLYSLGENISWQVEFSLIIPTNYYCWLFIEKPVDWEFIHAIDSFSEDKIGFCPGNSIGSSLMEIPLGHVSGGLWTLEAISQNYITTGNTALWDKTNISKFTFGDIFQINMTLNDTVSLPNTKVNATTYFPNGTIYIQESQTPSSYNVKFGNYTVGKNMSIGTYRVELIWTNNQSYLTRNQIGYLELSFSVWHHTNLTAVESYIEKIAGDPFLIKVKYTDYDLNTSISFASITYNSTFGQSGSMFYLGSGIYFLDLDTSGLELGDYYFSFNATKSFYENQTAVNLIHLKIIAQPLKLEMPKKTINAMGNNFAVCQVNVSGAVSGTLIWPANISTNWPNPYIVTDHNNGTFTLNFSTWNLPTQGTIETFSISVFASKNFYGNTTGLIAMTIYPIETIIGMNKSIFVVDLGESVDIKVNYTVEGSEFLILGANCSVNWPSLCSITSDDQGFVVCIDTDNLSIDTYTAIIKLEKPGFETAYKSITVIINRIDIEVNTINFQNSLEAFLGEIVTIQVNLTEVRNDIYIENASIFYSWEFGLGYFDYISNGIYELKLKLPETVEGNYRMNLIILKEHSIYKTKEFSFIISIRAIEQPNYVIWFIIFGLLIGISILGSISLRTYVILPLKRKKEGELLAKTQSYKDVINIDALVLSDRVGGLEIYSKSYYFAQEHQNQLLSGFIQAITMVSNEIVGKETREKITIKPKHPKGIEKIVELDFKHFNFFISDYKDIRLIFLLKEKASERFKEQTAKLSMEIELQFSDQLADWDGDLEEFSNRLPPLLDQYLLLHYKGQFKLNKIKYINQIKDQGNLSKMELRLLNVVISMTQDKEEFYLEDVVKSVYEKNKDKVIKALELLIEEGIIIYSKP